MNGAPQHVIGEFTELLQYHIMTFMDNTVAGHAEVADEERSPDQVHLRASEG